MKKHCRQGFDDNGVVAFASDDLMTRAEKIVHLMGYRGAVAGFAVNVFRLLQEYERLDTERQQATGRAAEAR